VVAMVVVVVECGGAPGAGVRPLQLRPFVREDVLQGLTSEHTAGGQWTSEDERALAASLGGRDHRGGAGGGSPCPSPCHRPDHTGVCRPLFGCDPTSPDRPLAPGLSDGPRTAESIISISGCPRCHQRDYGRRCRLQLSCVLGF